jgi:hypothetical protein
MVEPMVDRYGSNGDVPSLIEEMDRDRYVYALVRVVFCEAASYS